MGRRRAELVRYFDRSEQTEPQGRFRGLPASNPNNAPKLVKENRRIGAKTCQTRGTFRHRIHPVANDSATASTSNNARLLPCVTETRIEFEPRPPTRRPTFVLDSNVVDASRSAPAASHQTPDQAGSSRQTQRADSAGRLSGPAQRVEGQAGQLTPRPTQQTNSADQPGGPLRLDSTAYACRTAPDSVAY